MLNLYILSGILASCCYFSFFVSYAKPEVARLKLSQKTDSLSQENAPSDLSKDFSALVKRDILNTVTLPSVEETFQFFPAGEVVPLIPIPLAPDPIQMELPTKNEINFLPPLQVFVRGTIISSNPNQNKTFIENGRSHEEKGYSVGDIVEDAQIMFIGKDKVVFIRSNGQQESIYLHAAASIKNNEEEFRKSNWDVVVAEDENKIKRINVALIKERSQTVGHFINELDLATYFDKGIPVGCQIGANDTKGSLAHALGLKSGDLIISVNGIPTSTIDSRVMIYEQIMTHDYDLEEFVVEVSVMRSMQPLLFHYVLYFQNKLIEKRDNGIFSFDVKAHPHKPLVGRNEKRGDEYKK